MGLFNTRGQLPLHSLCPLGSSQAPGMHLAQLSQEQAAFVPGDPWKS